MATPLTPEIIAALLRGENPFVDGVSYSTTNSDNTWQGGDAGGPTGQMTRNFYASGPGDTYDAFDAQGNFIGTEKKGSVTDQWKQFLGTVAAMYGAGSLINGGALGFGGGEAGFGGLNGVDAAMIDAASSGAIPQSMYGGAGGFGSLGGLPDLPPGLLNQPAMQGMGPLTGAADVGAQVGGLSLPTIPANIAATTAGAGGAGGGGSMLKSLTDAAGGVGNVMGVAGLLGGIAGAKGGDDQTTTNKRTLDPRLDAAIFGGNGQGGLLDRVLGFVNANPTGMNADMTQAAENQRMLLNNPRVWGGLSQLGTNAQGLLNQPVAGNPFLNWRP